MSINVYRKKELQTSNLPKLLFLGLLILSLVGSIILSQKKEITVLIDNQEKRIVTFMSKAENILKSSGIKLGEKDHLSVEYGSKLKDGEIISVKRAVNVKVQVGADELMTIATAENTVEDMLNAEGIELGALDKISPELNTDIKSGMDIKITKIEKVNTLQEVAVDYPVFEEKNTSRPEDERTLLSSGRVGQKLVLNEVTYEDGKVVGTELLKETVIKEPVAEYVEVGTLKGLEIPNGQKVYYSSIVPVKATAYTGDFNYQGVRDDPYAGKTAVGTWAKRDPDGISTIAVDPRIIPLGTKVYVEGYGLAIAEDVGGAIKGHRIDVYYHKYPQTLQWGVRNVNVYILEEVQKN